MSDIITSWNAETGTGDWVFDPDSPSIWVDDQGRPITDQDGGLINAVLAPGIPTSSEIATAVLISLFSDGLASGDDDLPDNTGDRRGWWGGEIGSKLWLRQRAKKTDDLLKTVQDDAAQALAWMIEDGVAGEVTTAAEFQAPNVLALSVVIRRAGSSDLSLRFANLWDAA
jgi:phage gp46-like protein